MPRPRRALSHLWACQGVSLGYRLGVTEGVEPRRAPTTAAGESIVAALVESTALLLERDGYDAMTTNSIARVAGVSIGSLYQYFGGKEALVVALARQIEGRGRELAMERAATLDPTDPRAVVRAFVSVMLDPRLGSPAARRALLLEVPPAWILEASRATDGSVEALLVGVIAALGPALRPARADLMAFVAFHAVEGVVEEALLQAPERLSEPAFRAELLRLAWAYAAADGASLDGALPDAPGLGPAPAPDVLARLATEPVRRPPDGAPRTEPTTARGRASVDAILEATLEALAERGWAGLSTRDVARRAGVSKGTLYRYFPDLRAVIAEICRRRETRGLERLGAALEAPARDLAELSARVVRAAVELTPHEHSVRAALLAQVPPRYIRGVSQLVDAALRDRVAAHLASGPTEPGRAAPEVRAFVVAHAVERVIDAAILQRPALLDDPAFAAEITRLVVRYLGV